MTFSPLLTDLYELAILAGFQWCGLPIINVQNDFCPGGALPVAAGDQVPPLNREAELFVAAGGCWRAVTGTRQ